MKNFRITFATRIFIAVLVSVICLPPGLFAGNQSETGEVSDLSLGELLKLDASLVTATKRKISLRKAPAIATVITAEEIKNMGAGNITDVLKMVPGIGISISSVGRYMVEVRGIMTSLSEKILVMIDGHRLNDAYSGSAFAQVFSDLSLENVKQVEVVRGPGSALYGANAFVAVINVITKNADDIDDIEATVAGGSFNTKKINLLGSRSFEDLKIAGSFDYFDTDGADVTIEADRIAGTPFSMTPGDADLRIRETEAFLKVAYGDLILRGHFAQKDRGVFIGFGNALTDDNMYKHKNFWTELTYAKSFTDKFSASLRTYFDYFEQETSLEIFPEGFPDYPEGAIGKPDLKDRTLGAELQLDMDMFEGNHLILGLNFEHIRQYDVKHVTNFNPYTFEPLGSLQDVSSWGNFNRDVTRKVWAAYLQDEWEIRDDLAVTAGVRYDHYDDFGSTVNPRAGLVWNFLKNADLKLLYGQAFRAPNFADLYNDGNPSTIGNPDLDPETIKTYEAGLGYRLGDSYMISLNYFYNDIDEMIVIDTSASPGRFINKGGAEIDGLEVVLRGKHTRANYWQLTYTWQDPKDSDTKEDLPNVPSQKAGFSVNYELCKYLNAHADVLWTGPRPRASDDSRDDKPSYTTVDISLIAKNFCKDLEIQGTVHNLFDEEYEDPDLSGAQHHIPNDYPREGISAMISLTYRF